MSRPWAYLDPKDRETFLTISTFLNKRLAEQGSIDWALRLKPGQRVERIAIEELLNNTAAPDLAEPWATAWRLIEESWTASSEDQGDGTAIYGIKRRLRAGDRSGAVIGAIVKLVGPRIEVKPNVASHWHAVKKPKAPKTFQHLLSAQLTSGELIDLNVLQLAELIETAFLASLGNALEAAVSRGLDIARRLGWEGQGRLWQLGLLRRVYYVADSPKTRQDGDPDAYARGIAPSVKLLCAVVAQIAELDPGIAQPFLQRWKLDDSLVHVRLWAALSRRRQLTTADQVSSFFEALSDRRFWDLHLFPEIAELRACRFHELDPKTQEVITNRLQKGPPRDHWPRNADAERVKKARIYWAVRELKRIEVAGGVLPKRSKAWLNSLETQFADLANMTIDEGFPEGAKTRFVPPNPDDQYNLLDGSNRLRALETAFSASRGGWDSNPAERANDWLRQQGNTAVLLRDLEAAENGGDDFPAVWDRFGWAHRPSQPDQAYGPIENQSAEAGRVLVLLNQLSNATLSSAMDGICDWLSSWEKQVVPLPLGLTVWHRIWPLAVDATNRNAAKSGDTDLGITARAADDDQEPMDLDTLNTPSGKLVGVFLAACPRLEDGTQAFAKGSSERLMRDALVAADGRSGLIAKHRLLEALPYFLHADRTWAEIHLIAPLLNEDEASSALWRAIARRTQFKEVLEIIGDEMAKRATDPKLGRETRRHLVFSLVVESLHSFGEGRSSAVPNPRIQQMLRTLDDEVRASAANAVVQFIREMSAATSTDELQAQEAQSIPESAARLFRSAAAPFLREVWPQERSLATPGVSGALASLPAASGNAFDETVEIIARFLVPFECWSMVDYGLFGDEGEEKKLALVNNEPKATALLRLLDLTIGTQEGAVIPYDLTDALDQIQSVAPSLIELASFRRLSTAARR